MDARWRATGKRFRACLRHLPTNWPFRFAGVYDSLCNHEAAVGNCIVVVEWLPVSRSYSSWGVFVCFTASVIPPAYMHHNHTIRHVVSIHLHCPGDTGEGKGQGGGRMTDAELWCV
jgi:hypothetical protein